MEYRLLEKTELWVSPVRLDAADLSACAEAARAVFGLEPEEIMVTDVLGDRLTFDVLAPTVRAEQVVGQERALLEALAAVPGVTVTPETKVHSDGVLGLVSLDEDQREQVLERSAEIGTRVAERIRKRALVFSTGKEVVEAQIRDTNGPFLLRRLAAEGYRATSGSVLADDEVVIARAFRRAAEEGYGLLLTTGGIGAESKDQTLEALTRVDPQACLPYILRFQRGHGRHAKDGVRIGVGSLGMARIVCLPGPHDEVRRAWPMLCKGLTADLPKRELAEAIAGVLREKFTSPAEHRSPTEAQRRSILHDSSAS